MARKPARPQTARAKKRKPGRPRTTGIGTLVGVRCHEEFLKRLDVWRAEHEGVTRPDAIRRLAEFSLDAGAR